MRAPLRKSTTQLVAARLGLAAGQPPQILLVLPKEDAFARVLCERFAESAWSVRLAHPRAAAGVSSRGVPDTGETTAGQADRGTESPVEQATSLVVLDASDPEAQGVLDRLKLAPATNSVPVVALFPRGHDPRRPAALRIQADLELVEPFQVHEFFEAVDRLLVRFGQASAAEAHRLHLILPSTHADLDRACETVAALLRASRLPEDEQTSLLAAFREAAGNALQHGNRRDPAKTVRVEYRLDAARVAISIRDEGEGFDYRPFLRQGAEGDAAEAARARHRDGGQGGLGILMMVRSTDRIEYNERGNTVTFSKALP